MGDESNRAVSPALAIGLLVTITVALSVSVGVFVLNISDTQSVENTGGVRFDTKTDGVHVTLVTTSSTKLDVTVDGTTVHTFSGTDVGETVIIGGESAGTRITVLTNDTSSAVVASRELETAVGGSGVTVNSQDSGSGGSTISNPSGNTSSTSCTVDSNSVTVVYQGDGDSQYPYLIDNVSELQCMTEDLDADYKLVADVDASETSSWNGGDGFVPVGRSFTFTGTLDGDGHSISGVFINRSAQFVGIFSSTSSASITDLTVENFNITGKGDVGTVAGSADVQASNITVKDSTVRTVGNVTGTGGIVGSGSGRIENSTVSNLTLNPLESSKTANNHGGIAGEFDTAIDGAQVDGFTFNCGTGCNVAGWVLGTGGAKISNSYANVDINANSGKRLGGIVGEAQSSTIENSYATGEIDGLGRVGGIAGAHAAGFTVNQSYATPSLFSFNVGETGGISGKDRSLDASTSYWDIENTSETDDTPDGNNSAATGLQTSEMTGSSAASNMNEFDFTDIWNTRTGDYPELQANPE